MQTPCRKSGSHPWSVNSSRYYRCRTPWIHRESRIVVCEQGTHIVVALGGLPSPTAEDYALRYRTLSDHQSLLSENPSPPITVAYRREPGVWDNAWNECDLLPSCARSAHHGGESHTPARRWHAMSLVSVLFMRSISRVRKRERPPARSNATLCPIYQ